LEYNPEKEIKEEKSERQKENPEILCPATLQGIFRMVNFKFLGKEPGKERRKKREKDMHEKGIKSNLFVMESNQLQF
jgi:hypothetical protein